MDDEGVSSVVAVMLLLAVMVTSASVIAVNYHPILVKKTEISHAEKLREDFLGIASIYQEGGEIVLSLSSERFFARGVSSATLSVRESGNVKISISSANNSISEGAVLSHVNLSIHSTMIPAQTITFSQRGIMLSQYNTSIIKNPPVIDLTYDNSTNTLWFAVDNLTSGNETIAGSGNVVLGIRGSAMRRDFPEANVSITVDDGIFKDYWLEKFDELIMDSPNVFAFDGKTFYTKAVAPVNVTYVRRDVTVYLS